MSSSVQDSLDQDPAIKLPAADGERPLQGCRVCFIGKLGGMNRREARELMRRHGATMVDRVDSSVDIIVVGEDQLLLDHEQLLDDSVAEAVAEQRVAIINETQLWQRLGLVDADSDVCQLYTPAMLAQLLDVPVSTIRRWHRRGLITPTRQVKRLAYFDFQEVASARRLARLIASGAAPAAIESKLSRLTELYPDVARPLSQLSVIVQGKNVLLRQGAGLIEPGGQKHFDFEAIEQGAKDALNENGPRVLSIDQQRNRDVQQLSTPDQFLELAIEFEDENQIQSATEIYRAMGLAFGPSAEVSFRLGELLYQQGDLCGARERYYMAVELDESLVEARASLGCVLVELGQLSLADSAFQGALEHHEDYPDVHYHLARLYDETDRAGEAQLHWQRFLELAPHSPWADEARARLDLEDRGLGD